MTAQPDRSALLDEAREDEQPNTVHLTSAVPAQASTALLPCPFCGCSPRIVTRDVEPQGDSWYGKKNETFVLCECGACLFDGDFHEGFWDADARAPASWNRRIVEADSGPARSNETDFGSRIEHLEALVRRQQELLMQAREALMTCGENDGYTGLTQYFDERSVEAAIAAIDALEPVKGETL